MPLFAKNTNPKNNNQSTDTNQTDGTQNQTKQSTNPETKSGLMTIIGQLLPFAPLAFEQFTGQKVPHMTGTIAEVQLALINIQTNLQTIANNQQQLAQRLVNLETNANNHLTNLTNQFQSLRLTHTKERKEIEYNPNKQSENQENY